MGSATATGAILVGPDPHRPNPPPEEMTEKQDLRFKPTPRLEQAGDEHCKQAEDRQHQM
jgi:hypothetical protein